MGFFTKDMEAMIEIYQMESEELLANFDKILMQGQKNKEFTAAELNELFRVVHTIKSSSAMMGLSALSHATHCLEDIFNLFRDEPSLLIGETTDVFAVMYEYSDLLKAELKRLGEEDFSPIEPKKLMHAIEQEVQHLKDKAGIKQQDSPVMKPPAIKEGVPIITAESLPMEEPSVMVASNTEKVRVFLTNNCLMENVRSFTIINQLKSICEILLTIPAEFEQPAAAGQVRRSGLYFVFRSAEVEKVIAKLKKNPYVAEVLQGTAAEEAVPAKTVAAAAAEEPAMQQVIADEDKDEALLLEKKNTRYTSVRWDKIVELQNIAGELLTEQAILVNELLQLGTPRGLEIVVNNNQRLLADLENVISAVAMMPVSTVVPQLYRIVQDMVQKTGKDIELVVQGEELCIDRNLLDSIAKPLLHLIRNAIDHGICLPKERLEAGKPAKGTIKFTVENQGGNMLFRVEDDGRGLNPQAILAKAKAKHLLAKPEAEYTDKEIWSFISLPGFSTSEEVNEYSGRGVGMDVVGATVDSLGGSLTIDSQWGKGSIFTLQLPFSITSVESVNFSVGTTSFLLPIHSVDKILAQKDLAPALVMKGKQQYLQYEDRFIPVVALHQQLALAGEPVAKYALLVHSLDKQLCLLVEAICGEQVAVEKPVPNVLGQDYMARTGITACVLLGDGSIGFMLNVERLLQIYQRSLD